jgi:hypothetical protein
MTMSDKQVNWLPWIAVAALGYMLWTKPATPPGPQPEPVPAASIEKDTKAILAKIRTENARIFLEAADKVESGAILTDKALFDFVRPATEAARKEANKPFDVSLDLSLPRNEDGSFSGKEKEAASLLRRIAKSW